MRPETKQLLPFCKYILLVLKNSFLFWWEGRRRGFIGFIKYADVDSDENFLHFSCNEKLQQTHTHSLGFIVGIVLCSIFLGPIASAVNTVIVLFAEAPADFQQNYPELSNQMRTAWMGVYPGSV
jgi:hypothetical protein